MVNSIIIEKIKILIPKPVRNLYRLYHDNYSHKSYSQEGEDMILRRVFEGKKNGFYVDVGAHHPKRFSNTCYFYKIGWRGINIDAMPGSMKIFNKYRPRDINIETPVSNSQHILEFYIFNEPALNGFSKKVSIERSENNEKYFIVDTIEMQTETLEKILDENLPNKQAIDFLTIDVEGLDFEVLCSNNWVKYRPKFVLVEILKSNLEGLIDHEVTRYMKDKNYDIFAKSLNTVFFKDQALT